MPEGGAGVNTSPIIYLHRLGLLELLPALYGKVLVPAGVQEELQGGHDGGHDVPNLTSHRWLEIVTVPPAKSGPFRRELGRGESDVIAAAIDDASLVVIIDDGAGRRVAGGLGLRVTGTVGVLLRAKERGAIPEVAPLLEKLRETGMYLSDRVRMVALRLAGEA